MSHKQGLQHLSTTLDALVCHRKKTFSLWMPLNETDKPKSSSFTKPLFSNCPCLKWFSRSSPILTRQAEPEWLVISYTLSVRTFVRMYGRRNFSTKLRKGPGGSLVSYIVSIHPSVFRPSVHETKSSCKYKDGARWVTIFARLFNSQVKRFTDEHVR